MIHKGDLYPADVQNPTKFRVKWTGEIRKPKKGEFYLSGAIIMGYRAPNDLTMEYPIGRLVEVTRIEYYKEINDEPLTAEECEKIMVEKYGSHCANPEEHYARS